MHELLQKYKKIIFEHEVLTYEVEGSNTRLKLKVTFIDRSVLFVHEYIFEGQHRKYSFHWQDAHEKLLIRWDNAPHWLEIETYPHHKHIGTVNKVETSEQTELAEVLEEIARRLQTRRSS